MTQYISEINAVGLTTRKALGEAAEAAFLAKATSLGFGVAKTWGDSERYDFILDSGKKLWRVQVKSTGRSDGSRYIVKTRGRNSPPFASIAYSPANSSMLTSAPPSASARP